MTQSLAIPRVIPNNWKRLDLIVNKIKMRLGSASSPTFAGITVTGLTASTLIGANASKALESVTVGTGLVYATATLSLSHLGIEALTDAGADEIMFWDDSASACAWLGMGNSIAITDVMIDTIQDIRTSASPTFAGLHINSAEVVNTTLLTLESDIDNDTEYNEILFKVTGGANYGAIRSHVGAVGGDSYMSLLTTTDGGTLVQQVIIQHDGKVGLGKFPSQKLDIVAGNSGVLISYTGEGRGVAKSLFFGDGDGTWTPIVWGVAGRYDDAGLHLLAETADDSGTEPLIRLNARTTNADPITTRPILAIENNRNQLVIVDKDGNVGITGAVSAGSFTGLVIGTDIQAYDAVLDDISALAVVADNEFIVGTGAGTYAHESGATVRTSLGLGTEDTPAFANLDIGSTTYSFSSIEVAGSFAIKTSGDNSDYLYISTVSDVPVISTVGTCDLKITASSGEIDFDNENLTTTGTIASGVITQSGTTLVNTYHAKTTVGIADDNLVEIDDADAANTDYCRLTANGIQGRDATEVKIDLSLNNVENTAHSTDAHTMTIDGRDVSVDGTKLDGIEALADVTATNETSHADVLQDGDFGSNGLMERTGAGTYGIKVIGTDVQAHDAGLDALAALGYVSDSMIRITAENTYDIRTMVEVLSDIGAQPLDAELTSLAALSYVAASFVKMTGTNTFALRTLQQTSDDLEATIDHDNLLNFAANEHYLQSAITALGTIASGTWQGTTIAINQGGTGQTTAQAAIDALSAVSGATNEHVLTKDTASGNAIWKVSVGGGVSTWIALTDTDPANYTGQAGNTVVVNAGEDGLEFGAAPGGAFTSKCSVYRNAAQAITTGTWTKVQLNAEDYDTDGEFDSATNYRFEPGVSAYYHIDVGCWLDSLNNGKILQIGIHKNGAIWKVSRITTGVSASTAAVLSCDMYLLNTDYIELWVFHDHGSNRNTGWDTDKRRAWMDVHRFA